MSRTITTVSQKLEKCKDIKFSTGKTKYGKSLYINIVVQKV